MINRTRFMLDIDSEGFPLQDTTMASYNLTTQRAHSAESAALLADTKCTRCANPLGWNEIDGVMLPRITWAEEFNDGMSVEERKVVGAALLNGTLGFGS